MGLEFISRVVRTSAVTGIVLALVVWVHFGAATAGGFAAGCAWSLLNILVLRVLVGSVLHEPQRHKLRLAGVFFVKVPILYGIGYVLLARGVPVGGLLAGFGWPSAVVVLKAAGRLVLGLDRPRKAPGSPWTKISLAAAIGFLGAAVGVRVAAAEEAQHELPSLIDVAYHFLAGTVVGELIRKWENLVFSLLVAGFIILVARLASRKPTLQPGRLQNFVELVVEELEKFIVGVLGPRGKKYVPFLGTLFVYILCMNYSGLVPLLKAPTANINETLALALCVFFYVQYTAVKENGLRGYFDHLMGEPRSAVQWGLVWVMVPVHIIGELAKPVSLACRLFGNITGEDVLIFAFVGLGVALTSFTHVPIGIPLQIPFYGLAILLGFVQALVFMLLSTVYFAMVLPHEDETH